MDESNRSFEAPGETRRPSEDEEGGEGIEDNDDEELEEVEDDDEDDDDGGSEGGGGEQSRGLGELDGSLPPIEADLGGARSETLAVAPSPLQVSESDIPRDFAASSHLLSEVPVDYALLRPLESAQFKVEMSHQQALANVTTQAAEVQSQNLSSGYPTSSSELSPTSSTPNPKLQDQKPSSVAKANSTCMPDPESEQQKSSNSKTPPALPVMKMPSTDGFNWRKYGQKQVKSPQGSRSYYKCTYSECHAKKIECSDLSNRVIEIISKGQHNHDPPRRINCTKENQLALSSAPATIAQPETRLTDLDSSTSSKELVRETSVVPETKRQNSSASAMSAEIDIKEEHIDEPEPKRRMKKGNSAHSASPCKPGRKPKFVVHAAGDVGISGDGYRWRKYGQKMVKGNPHPRNYYRCTSAGCPVRKHIERAVDNTNAVIITYKGVHDHDMPVPKKRHGPPSAPLVAAAAPASMNNLQLKKPEAIPNQTSATQWSVDKEGELTAEALDAGEEKAIESARTLLSIGFEIKQC